MNRKNILRLISLLMLAAAAAFVVWAAIYPQTDLLIHIGGLCLDPDDLRDEHAIHAFYLIIMLAFFISSFFVKDRIK